MVRKRGKSRSSSATKRARRWKRKYEVEPTTRRYKILLPISYPILEGQLVKLDDLELILFWEYRVLGIPEAEWAYYTAYGKRRYALSLRLSQNTRTYETSLLREEFIQRGLVETWLRALDPNVDTLVNRLRGELTPPIAVLPNFHTPHNFTPPLTSQTSAHTPQNLSPTLEIEVSQT